MVPWPFSPRGVQLLERLLNVNMRGHPGSTTVIVSLGMPHANTHDGIERCEEQSVLQVPGQLVLEPRRNAVASTLLCVSCTSAVAENGPYNRGKGSRRVVLLFPRLFFLENTFFSYTLGGSIRT